MREQELTAIRHMRDVREALTQHLYATQNNLEEVLNQVVSDSFPVLGSGELAEPEGEVVERAAAAQDRAPLAGQVRHHAHEDDPPLLLIRRPCAASGALKLTPPGAIVPPAAPHLPE